MTMPYRPRRHTRRIKGEKSRTPIPGYQVLPFKSCHRKLEQSDTECRKNLQKTASRNLCSSWTGLVPSMIEHSLPSGIVMTVQIHETKENGANP